MSDEYATNQTTTEPRIPPDGFETWNEYWTKAFNQPWRTEPEIDKKQQDILAERKATVNADIVKGKYPFGGMTLNRADVEWLLATHENGRGPVNWADESQRERKGLDLRGVDLQGVYLYGLPLSRLRAGLTYDERAGTLPQMREIAAAHLEGADVSAAHLEQASLSRVHFEGAILRKTHLSGADLFRARLEGATLTGAHLEGADLRYASFDTETYLSRVILTADDTGSSWLAGIHWEGADLSLLTLPMAEARGFLGCSLLNRPAESV